MERDFIKPLHDQRDRFLPTENLNKLQRVIDGSEMKTKYLDTVNYCGENYVVLEDVDEPETSILGGKPKTILKIDNSDSKIIYQPVEDDKTLIEVFVIYSKNCDRREEEAENNFFKRVKDMNIEYCPKI